LRIGIITVRYSGVYLDSVTVLIVVVATVTRLVSVIVPNFHGVRMACGVGVIAVFPIA
jgi:hypothetical protein